MEVRAAKGLLLWWMNKSGYTGWCSLWGVMYLHPNELDNQELIRHENVHGEQMKRDGKVLFMIKYCWRSLRHGYWDNPYEIEAREAEL